MDSIKLLKYNTGHASLRRYYPYQVYRVLSQPCFSAKHPVQVCRQGSGYFNSIKTVMDTVEQVFSYYCRLKNISYLEILMKLSVTMI